MSKTQETRRAPERWEAHYSHPGWHIVQTQDAKEVAFVADTNGIRSHTDTPQQHEPERIARLIAAAPELLDACKRLLGQCNQYLSERGECDHSVNICVCELRGEIEDARAVIAKAEQMTA